MLGMQQGLVSYLNRSVFHATAQGCERAVLNLGCANEEVCVTMCVCACGEKKGEI
jgi:hypothetical protein